MERDIVEDIIEEMFEQALPEDLKEKARELLLNFLEHFVKLSSFFMAWTSSEKNWAIVWTKLKPEKKKFFHLLATTRQEKGIYTTEQFKFDICFAIEGFSEENSFECITETFHE